MYFISTNPSHPASRSPRSWGTQLQSWAPSTPPAIEPRTGSWVLCSNHSPVGSIGGWQSRNRPNSSRRRHLGGTYEVLSNGIDLNRYEATTDTTTDGPTISFLGRHEPRKGLKILLEAMAALPAGIRLWIAGDGPLGPALRRRYGHDRRVEWLGQLEEHDKTKRLQAASVLCVPSLHGESFGVNILEAMAALTPVVASDLPGYRQLASGGAALLVPPGNPKRLAAGLLAVLGHPAVAENIAKLGRQRAQRYDITELAERYISIYENVA